MEQEVYINEQEYHIIANNLKEKLSYMENGLAQIISEMGIVSEQGLVEGNAAKNFVSLTKTVAKLQNKMETLGSETKNLLEQFLTDIHLNDCEPGV